MAWLLPGVRVDGLLAAVLAVAAIGILNGLLWPLLSYLILPFAVLTLGLLSLVLNAGLVLLASQLVDGFSVTRLWPAIWLTLGLTAINTVLSSLLTIDDDNSWYRNVVGRRMRRRRRRATGARPVENDLPGVLFLEIDGLARPVLESAIRKGYAPTLAHWIERGSHLLIDWETDLSSQTSASQAGILHGNNDNIPAFRWWDRARKRVIASSSPQDVARLEATCSDGNGLLANGGASRGNLFSGDARNVMLTASVVKLCETCHDEIVTKAKAKTSRSAHSVVLEGKACMSCHQVHNADAQTWQFADGVHPTSGGHRLLGLRLRDPAQPRDDGLADAAHAWIARERRRRDSAEDLRLLYVAMTRAKRGLYVVTTPPGPTSKVFNHETLVRRKLAAQGVGAEVDASRLPAGDACAYLYSHGEERWFEGLGVVRDARPSGGRTAREAGIAARVSQRQGLVAVRPSDADALEASAADLFDPNRQLRLSVGSAVHELLQHVVWVEETDIDAVVKQWQSRSGAEPEVSATAVEQFRRALSSPGVRSALTRPTGNTAVWRERRFDVVIEGAWISGSFDRVVIERDAADNLVSATIVDFKTDEVDADAAASRAALYRQQMLLYRTALERIAGLSRERIRLRLIFTSPRVLVDLA